MRSPALALAAVATAFVILASVVALWTPAWEHSDEPGHVQNIETIVSGHWYRIEYNGKVGNEAHQPPLYYALLAGVQLLACQPARAVHPGTSSFPYLSRGVFLHHTRADHRFLLLLRFTNVVLGAVAILLTFLAARTLTSDPWTPVAAAALVAFVPRFVFLSAFVTNDNLVDVLGAALTLVALRCLAIATAWRFATLGAILGLLVVTKLSALPVILVVIPVAYGIRGSARRGELVAIAGAAALVVCGWYVVQNVVRYGDPLASAATTRYLTPIGGLGTFRPYQVNQPLHLIFVDVPRAIWNGFWYKSGWNQFGWPGTTNLVFWAALALALAGLVMVRRGTRNPGGLSRAEIGVLVTLTVTAFASIWIVSFSTATYEARLAYVGLPALACLTALGLERWKPSVRSLFPLLLLCGTIVAIVQDVLSVGWYR